MRIQRFHPKRLLEEYPRTEARMKRILAEIRRHEHRQDSLIEILHMVQDVFGYVPLGVMVFLANELRISPSRIYGVVTFYHFFSLKPKGEHNCLVCMGTACYVKGAQKILDRLETEFQIRSGETTEDGKLGVQTARCIGACGLAPAVVLDEEVLAKAAPEDVVSRVQSRLGVTV